MVDTLNFGFWGRAGRSLFAVEYQGTLYTGYLSLCAAIDRALDVCRSRIKVEALPARSREIHSPFLTLGIAVQEGIPITDARYLAESLTPEIVAHVFRSANDSEVLLLSERYHVLKETGTGSEHIDHRVASLSWLRADMRRSDHATIRWLLCNMRGGCWSKCRSVSRVGYETIQLVP